MKLSNELGRPGLLALLPFVAVQVVRVGRRVKRLPEAGDLHGTYGDSRRDAARQLRIVGDSVAAGVGVAGHDQTVAGRLAERWHRATGETVSWQVLARSGRTAAQVAAVLAESPEAIAGADVIVLSVGVNDVKGGSGDRAWVEGLGGCLDAIGRSAPQAEVFVLGLPPVELFPALPRPLSDVLGARARRLARLGEEVCGAHPRVHWLALDAALLGDVDDAFAPDGFHPSADAHRRLAEEIHQRLRALRGNEEESSDE